MKKSLFFSFILACIALVSCNSKQQETFDGNWAGTYVNEFGTVFTLNADSTAVITFEDDFTVESSWTEVAEEELKYVNIEFTGDKTYYYLSGNGRIYRSKADMLKKVNGTIVSKSE